MVNKIPPSSDDIAPDFNIRGYPAFYQYNATDKQPMQLWLCDSIIDSVPNRIALSCFGDKVCNINQGIGLEYEPLMFHVSLVDTMQSAFEALDDEREEGDTPAIRDKAKADMIALRAHLQEAINVADAFLVSLQPAPEIEAYPSGLTVKELKDKISTWPEVDEGGEPTQVWMETGWCLSSPVMEVWPLNLREVSPDHGGGYSADLCFKPSAAVFPFTPS